MADNQAVEELLKAEEQANNLIRNAQKEREKKLKEARISAEQEINIYRKEEEQRFQEEIKKVLNSFKRQKYGESNDEA